MTYEERVRAIAASAPPLTSAQLATIATILTNTKAPRVTSSRTNAEGLADSHERASYA